jgi:hypothetical protein
MTRLAVLSVALVLVAADATGPRAALRHATAGGP